MIHARLIGRSFRYVGVPPLWERWLEHTWLFVGRQAPLRPYAFKLETTPPLAAPGGAKARTIYHFDAPLTVLATPSGWWWGDERRGARVEVTSAELHVWVWGLEHTTPDSALAAVLSLAFQEGLRRSGLLPLHGAAAIPPAQVDASGGASLFIGPSGRGKTTTLLRAMRAGWAPVCEDTVWLEPATNELYSGDRGLRLLPDVLDALVPTGVAEPQPKRYKTFVPFSDLGTEFGVTWQPSAPLGRVVVLLRGRGGWQPLARLDAVPHLWEATFLPLLPQTRHETAAQIARVVQQTRLARLALEKPLHRLDAFLASPAYEDEG